MLYFTNPLSISIQIKVPNKLYQKYNLDNSEIIISPFLDCDILADSYIPLVLLDIPSHGVIVWRIGTNSKIQFLVHFMIMSPLCQNWPNVFKIFIFRRYVLLLQNHFCTAMLRWCRVSHWKTLIVRKLVMHRHNLHSTPPVVSKSS